MQLVPFQRYQIDTGHDAAVLCERLKVHVAAPRIVGRPSGAVDFSGTVSPDGFHLQPLLGRQVSFVPEIHGRFLKTSEGTTVLVQMVPATALLAIVAILGSCSTLLVFYSGWRVPLAIATGLVFSWLINVAGFWIDGGRSRRKLIAVLGEWEDETEDRTVAKK